MAGDTGSPQCQPTDLSMKSRRNDSNVCIEKVKADEYAIEDTSAKRSRYSEVAAYLAGIRQQREERGGMVVGIQNYENANNEAIRNAISAITRNLTPTSSKAHVRFAGQMTQTPTSEEDLVFVYSKAGDSAAVQNRNAKTTVVRSLTTSTSKSPEMDIYEEEQEYPPKYPFVVPNKNSNFTKDGAPWPFPKLDRPKYLNLREVPESQETSPDSGLGSATPIFGMASHHTLSESMTSPETPGIQIKFGQRKRKRKLGPGRGWKFHDLSNDGGASKKRAYAHNKLENEILQRFHDRVCVKSVPTPDGIKDKLIIVEPSEVTDGDLIRCGTALRLLFDKEAGSYKLQLLPYTLEEGPLSDQERVLQAVSKMLAENNEVLCPSVFTSLLRTGNSVVIGERSADGSCILSHSPTDTQYVGSSFGSEESLTKGKPTLKQKRGTRSPVYGREPLAKQRDRLLWTLNNELTRNNNALAGATAAGRKKCLMWHVPRIVHIPARPGKKYIPISKWCSNCRTDTPSSHA